MLVVGSPLYRSVVVIPMVANCYRYQITEKEKEAYVVLGLGMPVAIVVPRLLGRSTAAKGLLTSAVLVTIDPGARVMAG